MNPFEQMKLMQSSYTETDWQVYEAINANIDSVLRDTATTLASELGFSQPALTRFCQKLGYSGYSEFKMAVYQYHKSAAMDESPATAIGYYCELLNRIPSAVEKADIEGLADRLLASRAVFTTGCHKSALSAQLMQLNMLKFRKLSSFIPFDQFSSSDQFLTSEDTLVIFSAMGKTYKDYLYDLRENLGESRPYIVHVTMNHKSPLRSKVDQAIWLPNYQNQNFPQYLESQVTFMVFIDLLTNAIAQRNTCVIDANGSVVPSHDASKSDCPDQTPNVNPPRKGRG